MPEKRKKTKTAPKQQKQKQKQKQSQSVHVHVAAPVKARRRPPARRAPQDSPGIFGTGGYNVGWPQQQPQITYTPPAPAPVKNTIAAEPADIAAPKRKPKVSLPVEKEVDIVQATPMRANRDDEYLHTLMQTVKDRAVPKLTPKHTPIPVEVEPTPAKAKASFFEKPKKPAPTQEQKDKRNAADRARRAGKKEAKAIQARDWTPLKVQPDDPLDK
jgi:hypothetical protein